MTDTTALAAIQAAYPSRYYGQYDTTQPGVTTLTTVMDVWNGQSVSGAPFNVLVLPAADTMVPLTAEQFALAATAKNIWVKNGTLLYPARYYASYDTTAAQPTIVSAWCDTWGMSDLAVLATASDMIAVSATDWDSTTFCLPNGKGVKDGAIIDYEPPAPAVPMATQAASALTTARTYVNNNYTMLNEATPDAWVTYLKALMAIANGTDTTSTALPASPAQ